MIKCKNYNKTCYNEFDEMDVKRFYCNAEGDLCDSDGSVRGFS